MKILTVLVFSLFTNVLISQNLWKCNETTIKFQSIAPEEEIYGESRKVIGIIDFTKNTFAFAVTMNSFLGFNNDLQREHYNENYVESTKFPKAVFSGKLIDPVDLSNNAEQQVKVEGILKLHGVSVNNNLTVDIKIIDKSSISIKSNFNLLLSDYNISIPTAVSEKLSNSINVFLTGTLVPK